jgi:hypothetical protein
MRRFFVVTVLLAVSVVGFAVGQRESGDFRYDRVAGLEVDAGTFAVEVRASRGRHVAMEVENYPSDYTVYHSTSGSSVRVWVERDFPLFSRPHRGKLVFTVPADIDLTIDNSTGSVFASGLGGGDVRIETSTGAVTAEELSSGAHLATTTGRIDLRRSAGDFTVRSTTGSISITDVEGDLDVDSTTGRIELVDVIGRLQLRTSTGRQVGTSVQLTDDSSFNSTTGSIEIDLVNDLDSLEFDLTSTTGSLRVGTDRSQRRLFLGGTGLTVSGTTSTGSQHFF